MQRRSTNTKQTPDGQKSPQASSSGCKGGGGLMQTWQPPAQQLQHWCVLKQRKKQPSFCPLHPRYVNKKNDKKNPTKRENGEKAYIYTFVQKRHETKTLLVLCLHANKMSGNTRLRVFLRSLPGQRPTGREDGFLTGFFFGFLPVFHNTLDTSWSTESLWRKFYNRHRVEAVYQVNCLWIVFVFILYFFIFFV